MRKRKLYVETSDVDDGTDEKDDEEQVEDDEDLDTSEITNPVKTSSDEFLQSLTNDPTFEACLHLCKQAKVLVFALIRLL